MSKRVMHLFVDSGGWVVTRCYSGGDGTREISKVTCKRCNGTDMRYNPSYRKFVQEIANNK